jgi:hypothetical protein
MKIGSFLSASIAMEPSALYLNGMVHFPGIRPHDGLPAGAPRRIR